MAREFIPNKDFIKIIDNRLNECEFYLESKWFQIDGKRTRILKSDMRKEAGHLHVDYLIGGSTQLALTMKWTTAVYSKIDRASMKEVPFLRIPAGYDQYHKTWKNVDLIIVEKREYDTYGDTSVILYLDAPALMEYLDIARGAEQKYLLEKGISIDEQFKMIDDDRGIAFSKLERLGLIIHEDHVDWENDNFIEIRKQNHPDKELCFFINKWPNATEEDQKRHWMGFKLSTWTDRRKRQINLIRLSTGQTISYNSIEEVVDALVPNGRERNGKEVICSKEWLSKRSSIANVLAGKAKTFKTSNEKFSVTSNTPAIKYNKKRKAA